MNAGDHVVHEIIGQDPFRFDEGWNNVFAKIVCASLTGVLFQYLHKGVCVKNIISHRTKSHLWIIRHGFGRSGFFLKSDNLTGSIDLDNPEPFRGVNGNGKGRHGYLRFMVKMKLDHLPDIHPVNMIGSKDGHQPGSKVVDEINILIDRVGCPFIPFAASLHLRRDDGNKILSVRATKTPGPSQMLNQ